MDVRDSLIDSVRAVLTRLGVTPDPGVVQVERPSNPDHGDWSTNAALATARAAGRNPRELATALAEALTTEPPPHVTAVEGAGPGFVNFRLAHTWLHDLLEDVVTAGVDGWGASPPDTTSRSSWSSLAPTPPDLFTPAMAGAPASATR